MKETTVGNSRDHWVKCLEACIPGNTQETEEIEQKTNEQTLSPVAAVVVRDRGWENKVALLHLTQREAHERAEQHTEKIQNLRTIYIYIHFL